MDSALLTLSKQLRESADPELLDRRLDQLHEQVASDEAGELLVALYEAGVGTRLRDVLEDDKLARWAAERCTVREEEALAFQLRSWLGAGDAGPDDPARLCALEPPPTERSALLAWAERHELSELLLGPADRLLPQLALPPSTRLLELCLGLVDDQVRGVSLLARARASEQARGLLRAEAARRAALPARAALHARPLPGAALGLLARRLRALFEGTELRALERLRFVPARPVALELASGVARGALVSGELSAPVLARILLSGFELRALEGSCSACSAPRCLHVQALAARLFDACLSREDRLHGALVSLVSVPSWQRFMAALGPSAEAEPRDDGRLTFALRIEAERLLVGLFEQRSERGGRAARAAKGKLLSAHKAARSPLASDRDQGVIAALLAHTRTLAPQFVVADVTVLRALVEHPAVVIESSGLPVRISEERLQVSLLEQPEGLKPQVALAGRALSSAPQSSPTRPVHYLFVYDPALASLTFAPLLPALARLLSALAHFRGVLPPESYGSVAPWLATLQPVADVQTPKRLEGLARPPPERLLLRITPRLDEGVDVTLTVRALPLAPLWSPGQGPALVYGLEQGVQSSVRRDLARERALAAQVIDTLALSEQLELAPFSYRIETTQGALELLARAARASHLLELEWAERRRTLQIAGSLKVSDLKIALFKRGAWCALSGGVQHGDALIAIDRLLLAARSGERFVPIAGDSYLELEQALFERLSDAQLCIGQQGRSKFMLPSAAAPLWLSKLGAQTVAGDAESAAWLSAARAPLALDDVAGADEQSATDAPELPLEQRLRSYQKLGVRFLLQRSSWAPGACLADEMGLGKTVQTIAVLLARRERGPALVLAPTSVVDNWMAELAQFAPELDARRYRGAARAEQLTALGPGSVLVASYELLVRDRAQFEPHSFATLVIDEAQCVKNARTQRARAVLSVAAEFRIALSGTPLENRLGDLWSLFHLLAPGLLGSWARFRARFAVPIERYENDARAAVLRGLIAPFLLRRTKREVAAELPARTEVVHLIELTQPERELYGAALVHARTALGKRRRDDPTRSTQLLAELTKLRQLACHPRLVLDDSRVSSSKLALLTQLLSDLLPRGHRVLIFSQFVRHLALVREAVEQLGVAPLQLDGSTPAAERAQLVARFQAGAAPVFLISLKAGGTGLNLTAADYVIHMDPWWNPSAEDQASDRAHRLGQERPVTVIKLVAQGTIEERVLGLHAHKRKLAELVVADHPEARTLSPDLRQLEQLLDS